VILDGEVPQALGFGHFLAIYNHPVISGIHSRNPIELLSHCLKTCEIHFERCSYQLIFGLENLLTET
jgi:hypothetical protein